MNTSEGLRRIATVVRWIGYFFAGAMLVIATVSFTSMDDALVFAALSAIPAAMGWGLGWIIDGFAAPKAER